MIVFNTDGGDFAKISVDGCQPLELCSDTHDITTAREIAFYIAKALDIDYIELSTLE